MAAWTARRALWLLVWSLLWSVSVQQDTTYSFVNPPPEDSSITDPSYTVGADINIEWVGPNDFVSVRLVHVLADDNVSEFTYVFRNVTNLGGQYTWTIALNGMNLTSSTEFFFNIFVEGETSPRAITHNFDLSRSSTSSSSSGSSSTTSAASTSSASSSSSTTSSVISTPTDSPTNIATATNTVAPSSGGLSTGAKAGIGIGVAVGVIALIGAAFFFWRRQRGQPNTAGAAESGQSQGSTYQPVNQQAPHGEYYKPPGAPTEPSEVPANYVASELSGSGPAPLEMADTSRMQH